MVRDLTYTLGPEDWERVRALLHAAADVPADLRREFLYAPGSARDDAAADPVLREVESLLGRAPAHGGTATSVALPGAHLPRSHPERIGDYPILRELGRGGMGVVYLAKDPRLQRPVALKLLVPRFGRSSDARRVLMREAQLLASLNHRHIATIYSFECEQDRKHRSAETSGADCFLTMEYVPGPTLAEMIHDRSQADVRRAIDLKQSLLMARQLCAALEFAHGSGVVHRDLKPGNLKWTPSSEIKILDFGLAGVLGAHGASPSVGIGTPGYSSPEQVRGENGGAESDVFSLCCVLYECLTNLRAIAGESAAQRIDRTLDSRPLPLLGLEPLARAGSSELAEVVEWIRAGTSHDAHTRPTVATLRRALERAVMQTAAPHGELVVRPRSSVPHALTELIGRRDELALLEELSVPRSLVSVVGTGGSGKTRLVLEYAQRQASESDLEVAWVELAELSPQDRIDERALAAIAQTFMPESMSMQTSAAVSGDLIELIEGRNLLVVLDNCEHVVDACAHFAQSLLARCPVVRIIATSREALGIAGELIFELRPLPPPPAKSISVEALAAFDCVALFCARATQAAPNFVIGDHNGEDIARICRRLDGLPLAIELAAAMVGNMPVGLIARRLEQRLHLPGGGRRSPTAPHRRDLNGLIDWSYDLLNSDERRVFRALSVFAGGWSLPTLEAVIPAATGLEAWTVLDAQARLVATSLVEFDVGERFAGAPPAMREEHDPAIADHARYRLLEVVRVRAIELADHEGELASLRDAHSTYYHDVVAARSDFANGSARVDRAFEHAWFAWLEQERDNLRIAFEHALTVQAFERAFTMANGLQRFWTVRGHYHEGRQLCDRLLALTPPSLEPESRARVSNACGVLASYQGDGVLAQQYFEKTLPLREAIGDHAGLAITLNNLGILYWNAGDYERAVETFRQSLEIKRRLDHQPGIAMSLTNLGNVESSRGRFDESLALHCESLRLLERLGDARRLASVHSNLGRLHTCREDYAAAEASYLDCLRLRRELNDAWGIATTMGHLAEVAIRQRHVETAARWLTEAVERQFDIDDKASLPRSWEAVAALALLAEQRDVAVELLVTADAIRRRRRQPASPQRRVELVAMMGADFVGEICARGAEVASADVACDSIDAERVAIVPLSASEARVRALKLLQQLGGI